jgi:hypothetical protein
MKERQHSKERKRQKSSGIKKEVTGQLKAQRNRKVIQKNRKQLTTLTPTPQGRGTQSHNWLQGKPDIPGDNRSEVLATRRNPQFLQTLNPVGYLA